MEEKVEQGKAKRHTKMKYDETKLVVLPVLVKNEQNKRKDRSVP